MNRLDSAAIDTLFQTEIVEDPHSFSNPENIIVTHIDLDLEINFEIKQISGRASLSIINKNGSSRLFLDMMNLNIEKVTLDSPEEETSFRAGRKVNDLGEPLIINLLPNTKTVHVYYSTNPDASALQWLDPVQTAGGRQPFLFTQSQAILARSWIPCQDSPGVRFTYTARIKTDPDLLVLMSAENPTYKSSSGVYTFEMPQPIPSYLLALAAGDIMFQSIGERSGVYAEPSVINAATKEFEDTEKMIESAEKLYGPYRWERYDIIVLPPSFPYGGMENPRLTFVTPTVIAGDKSLTALIAHELAHSWSGNLVTNATWNDFWLNEGFTSYIENRIMEDLYGREYAEMLAQLAFQDLEEELERLGMNSQYTKLALDLPRRDPDNKLTSIAYDKGSFFLRMLEEYAGRTKWDAFLNSYFNYFAFEPMTTELFIKYLEMQLLGNDKNVSDSLKIYEWIFEPGLPDNCPVVTSEQFILVETEVNKYLMGIPARNLVTRDWTTHHWIEFIRNLPDTLNVRQMASLDVAFNFSKSENSEILFQWLLHSIKTNYFRAYSALEAFLLKIGRRKFLKPLYLELAKTPDGLDLAREIYTKARATYHPVTYHTIDTILKWDRYLQEVQRDSLEQTTE
ncbi:MAG: aminopeptidase [Desulfobacterales bacterium SG8_35_2]|nr:MAG: aminopeptidase [Desulfobacterales bacterium SG8_35_2]